MNRILVIIFITALSTNHALAYLDGGSASMLVQLILGGTAGLLAILKLYWHKIISFFKRDK